MKRSETEISSVSEASAVILDWVDADTFHEKFPHIQLKSLKWQLDKRFENGLAPYVQVIGKKRYISITGYAQWLNDGAGKS